MLALVSGAAAIVVAGWSADLLSAFSLPSPIPAAAPHRRRSPPDRVHGDARRVRRHRAVRSCRRCRRHGSTSWRRCGWRARSARAGPGCATSSWSRRLPASTLFLTTALLFVRSFWTQASTNPGFETAHLLVLELKPSDFNYDAARSRILFDNLVERVRALPGVERVALGDRIPFYVGFPKTTKVSADGTDCATIECRDVYVYGIGPGYMAALGVPVGVRSGVHRAGRSRRATASSSARSWPRACGRAASAVGEWIREGTKRPATPRHRRSRRRQAPHARRNPARIPLSTVTGERVRRHRDADRQDDG